MFINVIIIIISIISINDRRRTFDIVSISRFERSEKITWCEERDIARSMISSHNHLFNLRDNSVVN